MAVISEAWLEGVNREIVELRALPDNSGDDLLGKTWFQRHPISADKRGAFLIAGVDASGSSGHAASIRVGVTVRLSMDGIAQHRLQRGSPPVALLRGHGNFPVLYSGL